jgi:GNAT superfamily N-acetyltransferase
MQSSFERLEVNVREALASDARRIAALALQLGYDVTIAHVETFLAARTNERELFVAVVPRAGVVGWIGAHASAPLTASKHAVVDGLVVEDEYRGVRVGEALLQRVEAWARARECTAVRLRANVVRERAHEFYRRHGYAVLKTQHLFAKSL